MRRLTAERASWASFLWRGSLSIRSLETACIRMETGHPVLPFSLVCTYTRLHFHDAKGYLGVKGSII
jgi:hypothetical protein